METAKVSSTFLSNIVEKLNISRFSDTDLALKAILKNKNHPSIITIESKYKHVSTSVLWWSMRPILKKEINLNGKKASQNSDMPNKVV